MERDFNKLRGRIIEKYRTISNFAEKIGVPVAIVSMKLNGTKPMTYKDILKWYEPLGLEIEDIGTYFFAPKV